MRGISILSVIHLALVAPATAAERRWVCAHLENQIELTLDESSRLLSIKDSKKTDEGFAIKRTVPDSPKVTYYLPYSRPGQSYYVEYEPSRPSTAQFQYCAMCGTFVCSAR